MYLIRKRQLGDVVWIEPIIRELSKKYKKLVVHTKFNEIFEQNIYKNVIFKSKLTFFEKLLIRFDFIFHTSFFSINLDGTYELNPKQHILHAYQTKAKLPIENTYPRIQLSKEEMSKNLGGSSKYAIIHIESFSLKNYRNIHGIEWEVVANYLTKNGFKVIQVGKNNQHIDNTSFIKTNIRDLISLMNKCTLFIGIDSFPSHLAAIFKIPSLIFFGAINPNFRHFNDHFIGSFMQGECEFAGCYHNSSNGKEVSCKLVGNEGIPKCSFFQTNNLIPDIENFITKYKL